MKGSDDNKTRINYPSSSANKKDQQNSDKTIFTAKKPTVDEQTRIQQSSKRRSASDATQFKSFDKDTKTKIPLAKKPVPESHAYSFSDRGTGHHGVLKERFILVKVIGTGGMGVVYKAKDLLKVEAKDRNPYVAIKVLSEEFKAHPEAFISLQRESRKSQHIAHPNIVNVFDFDRDGDVVFMTMEYMDGKPLDQLLRQYKSTGLPSDDVWSILQSMCAALIHAHGEKIIHSDFKPGNIFVTNKSVTKVFDFGIARAVAKVTHLDDNPNDRTVFDAGNLGALTPAYASLEMLEGQVPDVRDDIYALGCVAYEMLMGVHPFKRAPADEAERQGLIPNRINGISKRQWLAIKNALAFRREDRTATVEEFLQQITVKFKRNYTVPAILLLTIVLFFVGYMQFFNDTPQGFSEAEIRNKLEYELQLDFHKNTIDGLIQEPVFSIFWEEQLWTEYKLIEQMFESIDKWMSPSESEQYFAWFVEAKKTIYNLYLLNIRKFLKNANFPKTETLIQNAARYTQDFRELEIEKQLLASAIAQYELQQKKKISIQRGKKIDKKKRVLMFNIALKNVNQQLQCQSRLSMRNLDVAIGKLKTYNIAKYKQLEPKIIHKLAVCITELGKPFPEKAQDYKKYALRIFNRHKEILAIRIIPRDPCNTSIAGLGGRGKRSICQDKFKGSIGSGPELVVIFGKGSIKTFAIGKYEVAISELNMFCKKSSVCAEIKTSNDHLPVTNIKFSIVKAYLKWLTRKTNKKYRLPTKTEWLYAATANTKLLDPNRNCFMRTRGIKKGAELFDINVGRANQWGVVNYIGNAQEWVYDRGRKLVAVGGSFNSHMDTCNLNTVVSQKGSADLYTGFRVLREMKK